MSHCGSEVHFSFQFLPEAVISENPQHSESKAPFPGLCFMGSGVGGICGMIRAGLPVNLAVQTSDREDVALEKGVQF